jgi:WD40 repeat protein
MNRIFVFILGILGFHGLSAQSINTEFGKNRIQFHDDFNDWWEYETANFITYWYGKSKNIAIPTLQIAEMDHDDIQRVMEHRINDKIEIIVYVDISDLKQSNIGTEETFTSRTGETKIAGNKMFVYFNGDHQDLRKKIREGIATVYFNNMLFGSSLQEIIQNAVLLNIPDWYKDGIVAYTASPWNHLVEDELRDIWARNKKYHNFKKLANDFPKLAGHSFWFYVDQNYGKSSIANLLYLTKISRGMENSFEYILNADIKTLHNEWSTFYENYFKSEKGRFAENKDADLLKLSNKKYSPISHLCLSPDGKFLAYAFNDQGKYRVKLRDMKTGSEKRIFKYGYKNIFQETDYNYPLIAWHPSKPELSIAYEHRDVINLIKYDIPTAEKMVQIIPTDFQRLYSISYINDLDYIFSASQDGFSDLYLYKSKNRNHQRLTQDYFDDLDAQYIHYKGERGILFSSNRTMDTIQELKYDTLLPLQNFDIYFWPDGAKTAKNLTRTHHSNERYPMLYNGENILCVSDESGINNTYQILDGSGLKPLSNLDRNLIRHHAVPNSKTYIKTYYKNGAYVSYEEKLDLNNEVKIENTSTGKATQTHLPSILIVNKEAEPQKNQIIDEKYLFQTKFPDPKNIEPIKGPAVDKENTNNFTININKPFVSQKSIEVYNNTRAIAAKNKFALTNVTTKLDNDLLFEGLESYTGDRQQLLTTPVGFLLKATVEDLFEDFKIETGVRIPTTFNGAEYFLVFDNKKKRIDKKIALYRRTSKYNNELATNANFLSRSKKTTTLGLYQLKFPFDIYRSIRATGSLRFDRYLQLSTENNSLSAPALNEKRISLRLEYIYDNTHDAAMNIKHGTRYKIYSELINNFNLEFIDGFNFEASNGYTGIVGFDARHYIPLLRKSILAIRGAGATSFGSQKMLYYMGGMENWIFPSFNNNIPVPDHSDYAFKANVFQLRGFNNNIRNGATFLVTNTELRIPFMQYILGKNRGNAFFRNLQLTGFFDAGLAFHGSSPFSDKNPLNKIQLSSPPVLELEIEYFRDPLVMGFGTGLRTQLLGYFVKADYGWGIETRQIQKPRLYLSLGLDF